MILRFYFSLFFTPVVAAVPNCDNKSLQYLMGVIELGNRHAEAKHLRLHLLRRPAKARQEI